MFRQAAYRWRKFIQGEAEDPSTSKQQKAQGGFDLCEVFNFSTDLRGPTSDTQGHRFEIRFEPAEYTEEKFELYKKYQTEVHNDRAEEITKKSFERFLCTNPFGLDGTVAKHACWLIDEKLIAFSVIDILPLGISSVYLVWDTNYAKYGIGRLASLREIGWIQEWRKSDSATFNEKFDWYYLGFYIHSCPKMTYKAEYSPSFLLDPSSLDWKSLETCRPILDGSETNVTSFSTDQDMQELQYSDNRGDFQVKILTRQGAIETVKTMYYHFRIIEIIQMPIILPYFWASSVTLLNLKEAHRSTKCKPGVRRWGLIIVPLGRTSLQ
ncbi:hypothetical protein PSTT_02277 [Puccinia striiformis]|uniref:N-end rule aminoacyl transferase C-terminal domain-containing protein n=1 Tax=Puccinia striiformis TaxID=27350 RepID=A0A2S4W0J8_9BASI|nr:hypothetical protein PSTT_02277 [Puccinia striiformis]